MLPQITKVRGGDRAAIHITTGAPFSGNHPSQDNVVVFCGQIMLSEPFQSGRIHSKRGSHVGFIVALSYGTCFRPLAQGQAQCPQQDGLTGAGFTGDNCHALRKIEFHMLDEGKLMNRQ